MRYCLTHERAEIPAGLVNGKRWAPAHWHPLPRGTVALAVGVAQAGGCAGQIVVEQVPCDACQAEASSRKKGT